MSRPEAPLRILIVEDEALLVMDLEAMIEDAGHVVVGEAASLRDTMALGDVAPDIAFVDMQLAHGDCGVDVCAYIHRQWACAVIVYVTANPKKIPDDFAGGHGVIPKPFSRAGLTSAMRFIEEGVCDPPPSNSPPASFTASPRFAATWR
ncbi:response regulator [Sphingomonas koreensis]|nr:response regulator [Sphingomonas koreensis]